MFTLPWELLETSYFYAVSTQVSHTSPLSPNLSFPHTRPDHPLRGKKENKTAKMFGGKNKKDISSSCSSECFSRFLGGRGLHPDWYLGVMLKWPSWLGSITPSNKELPPHWKPWRRCDQAPCAPGSCSSVPPQLSSRSKASVPCWDLSNRCAFLQARTASASCAWFGKRQGGWFRDLHFLQMLWTNKKSKLCSQTPWPSLIQSPQYNLQIL